MRKRRFKDAVLQGEGKRPPLPKYPSMEDLTRHLRKIIREEIKKRDKKMEKELSKLRLKKQPQKKTKPMNQHQSPPEFSKSITDCQVVCGETAHFVYVLESTSAVSVQWFHNSSPMMTRTTADGVDENQSGVTICQEDKAGCLIFNRSEAKHSGLYKCVASNEFGSTQCTAILVVANAGGTDDELDEAINSVISETFSDTPQVVDSEVQTLETYSPDEDSALFKPAMALSMEEEIFQKVMEEIDVPAGGRSHNSNVVDDCSGEGSWTNESFFFIFPQWHVATCKLYLSTTTLLQISRISCALKRHVSDQKLIGTRH